MPNSVMHSVIRLHHRFIADHFHAPTELVVPKTAYYVLMQELVNKYMYYDTFLNMKIKIVSDDQPLKLIYHGTNGLDIEMVVGFS